MAGKQADRLADPSPHPSSLTTPISPFPLPSNPFRETYGDKAMKEPERLNAVTGEYAAACRSVAESYGAVSGRKREREEGSVGERGEDVEAKGQGMGQPTMAAAATPVVEAEWQCWMRGRPCSSSVSGRHCSGRRE